MLRMLYLIFGLGFWISALLVFILHTHLIIPQKTSPHLNNSIIISNFEKCKHTNSIRHDGMTCVKLLNYILDEENNIILRPDEKIWLPPSILDKLVTPQPKPIKDKTFAFEKTLKTEDEEIIRTAAQPPCKQDVFTGETFLDAKVVVRGGVEQCFCSDDRVAEVYFVRDSLLNNNGVKPNALVSVSSDAPSAIYLAKIRNKFIEGFYYEGISLFGKDRVYWSQRPLNTNKYRTYTIDQYTADYRVVVDDMGSSTENFVYATKVCAPIMALHTYKTIKAALPGISPSPLVFRGNELLVTDVQYNLFKIVGSKIITMPSNIFLEAINEVWLD